jgi:MscS family membrane protein
MPSMRASTGPRRLAGLTVLVSVVLALAPLPCRGSQQPAASDQPASVESSAGTPGGEAEAPDSPRASLRQFYDLTSEGDYVAAARYLQLPHKEREHGPELARKLREVLDQDLIVDLATISPLAAGDRSDGLPADTERVAFVPAASKDEPGEPIFMVRAHDAEGAFWAFSDQTVARIDGWYSSMEDRWLLDRLPKALQRHGPWGKLLVWHWIAIPLLLLVAWTLGPIFGSASSSLARRALRKAEPSWQAHVPRGLAPVLTLLWTLLFITVLLPLIALPRATHTLFLSMVGAAATLVLFWGLWRAVDLMSLVIAERAWAVDNPSARSLLAVGRNLAKAAVAVGAIVATIAAFGYPVATVLAGLGIGGVALAFGAQKTVENLFGSVSLAADQPFRVGDFVRVDDLLGTVENVGLRSTRIRTLDRTLVTIPNGKLADLRIESFSARDRIRLATTIGLVYETTLGQMRQVLDGFRNVLSAHPQIWPDTIVVSFSGFGASSLDIDVMCWFQVTDFNEFRAIRQEVLLELMRVVEDAGTGFAFPTRTIHLLNDNPAPSGSTAKGTDSEAR